jgi:hypothetical protein
VGYCDCTQTCVSSISLGCSQIQPFEVKPWDIAWDLGLGFRIPQFLVWCFFEVVMAYMLAIIALGNGYMYPNLT